VTYAVGDKVMTMIGGKWLPAVITKPPHKETGNYGVRVKAGTRTINTVSSTDQLKKSIDEKVHRIGGDAEKKGAPTDKARAFDKVNPKTGARPNRSVLKQLEKMRSNDQDYAAMDISEDPDYTMVLVAGGQTEPYLADGEEYYGVNVLFYPSGKVDAATADKASDWQWKHHKDKIIAAAKKALKKHDVDIYRGGKPMKESKQPFKIGQRVKVDVSGWKRANQKSDGIGKVQSYEGDGMVVKLLDSPGIANELLVYPDDYSKISALKEGMMTFKEFLLTEGDKIGWYVEKDDKTVAGPFTTEDQAQTICKNKGGDAEGFTVSYVSDYDEKRMNEKKVDDEEYFITYFEHDGKSKNRKSRIELYTEKAYKSHDAAERALEKFKNDVGNSRDSDTDAADDERDLLDDCSITRGAILKRDYPKLFEAKKGPMGVKLGGVSSEDHSFGFEDRANAKKTDAALKSADIEFTRSQAGGIFYFHFDSAADMKKAVRLAKGVIDKSEESEW
jgi:hypothetical protein